MRLVLIVCVAIVVGALLLRSRPTDALVEYGRLMRWRARLIDEGVPPALLETPLYPDPSEWVHG